MLLPPALPAYTSGFNARVELCRDSDRSSNLISCDNYAIPPGIEQEAAKAGLDLAEPTQKKAIARAIVDAKLTSEPTHKQVISIAFTSASS
jgi:hypothetical protein